MNCVEYIIFGLLYVTQGYNAELLTDAGLNTGQQVLKYGYPFENHSITTEDGYILAAHRIPYGKAGPSPNRQSILLIPGLWRSSEVWVNFGPEKSLGFILADSGFDVWIGNYRGTTWSKRHIKWNPYSDAKQFWNYSVDELGYYDCPAFIDYILNITGRPSLTYVGETLGASMFFIMAAEKPTYISKVNFMITFAPMVYIEDAKSPIYTTIALNQVGFEMFANLFETYEILPHAVSENKFVTLACSNFFLRYICELIHSMGVGFDSSQLNRTAIPLLLNGFPAGSSLKELVHISQWYATGAFAKYDYGCEGNLKVYGKTSPPVYHLNGITTPIVIYYGGNDILVDKEGVERLATQLKNVSKTYIEDYNDGDFLWANNVVHLIYDGMIGLIKSYYKI